jgi:hypothetical protein
VYNAILRCGIAANAEAATIYPLNLFGSSRKAFAAVIDDIEWLNSMQQAAAYEKCESGFDWSDRGQTLRNAIRQAVNRQCAAHARRSHYERVVGG